MPLKMLLAIGKGTCGLCKDEDVWLYSYEGKIRCDECVIAAERLENQETENGKLSDDR